VVLPNGSTKRTTALPPYFALAVIAELFHSLALPSNRLDIVSASTFLLIVA
jgi:hypothetical protein